MGTLEKIRAAFATRPGNMPSEAYRRAALTLFSDRALTISDAEFDQLAVTLGITEQATAERKAERSRSGKQETAAPAQRQPSARVSERGAA